MNMNILSELIKLVKTLEIFFPKNFKTFEEIIKAILSMNGKKQC